MSKPEPSSSRIIHISDIHCTTQSHTVGWPTGNPQNTVAKCAELVTYLTDSSAALRTDKVLISGDLVDSNYNEYYDLALQQLIQPLSTAGFDVTLVPGNHDYFNHGVQFLTDSIAEGRQRFFDHFSPYLKTGAPDAYPVDLDLGHGYHLILVDSLKGHFDVHTDSHRSQGNIGAQQTAWLNNTLPTYQQGRDGGMKIALATHHSPFETDTDIELTDAGTFLPAIRGRIDALIFGHTMGPHKFYANEAGANSIPIITSENIEHMSNTGYPISVIDLGTNLVEVYSTSGGPPGIEGLPNYSYGSHGESAFVALATTPAVSAALHGIILPDLGHHI